MKHATKYSVYRIFTLFICGLWRMKKHFHTEFRPEPRSEPLGSFEQWSVSPIISTRPWWKIKQDFYQRGSMFPLNIPDCLCRSRNSWRTFWVFARIKIWKQKNKERNKPVKTGKGQAGDAMWRTNERVGLINESRFWNLPIKTWRRKKTFILVRTSSCWGELTEARDILSSWTHYYLTLGLSLVDQMSYLD